MKELICEKDIQALIQKGKTCCKVGEDAIITPSAQDAAAAAGISFARKEECTETPEEACGAPQITPELILKIVQGLIAQGRLSPDFYESLLTKQAPYEYERDACGLKIIRGDSVHPSVPLSGDPKVRYQEVVGKHESSISSGILEFDHGTCRYTQEQDETAYVLEGSLTIIVGGTRYTARQGDCVLFPKGAAVELGDENAYCKIFRSGCTPA